VTVIAGFKASDGVVLCADTQETVGVSKRNVPKLRVEPSADNYAMWPLRSKHDLAVAFCGATDNGPFLDEIVDKAWEAVQEASSLKEAEQLIGQSIKDSHREFGQIYQPGYLPHAELIYGIKIKNETALFHAFGPAITKQSGHVSGGIGSYMVDFLSSRMFTGLLSIRQCVILAAYVLFQTKEHVDGCGGESHIAVLPNVGTFGLVDAGRTRALTNLLEMGDVEIGKTLLQFADIDLSSTDVKKAVNNALATALIPRETEIENQKENERWWEEFTDIGINELGLLDSEKRRSNGE
jgi:hypothetical protein